LESRLASLLPPLLFELVQQSGNSSIDALYSVAPRSYARDRLCLAGDAGAVFPPFTGSGVLKAVVNATSLVDALVGAPAVDDALHRWSQAQLQVAAQVMPTAELIERRYVFGMPDFTIMPAAATNDWMSSAFSGFGVTLPGV
jgi:2-polyprenyl-6-methoxyphenol hydroxylase-like FAD-dependent oxidoreductase